MSVTRRIYVSLTADRWLPKSMNDLKWGSSMRSRISGYTPEILTNPSNQPGLASSRAWALVTPTKWPTLRGSSNHRNGPLGI